MAPKRNSLVKVNVRLFADDIRELHKRATANGVAWNIELRLLVRRALRGERREIAVLTEVPGELR